MPDVPTPEQIWAEANAALRQDIEDNVIPAVVELWRQKNANYKGQMVFLGPRGQFSDINRKFWKLKQAMWDGEDLSYEQRDEVLADMIGHCLNAMAMYRQEQADPTFSWLPPTVDDLNLRSMRDHAEQLRAESQALRKPDCPCECHTGLVTFHPYGLCCSLGIEGPAIARAEQRFPQVDRCECGAGGVEPHIIRHKEDCPRGYH